MIEILENNNTGLFPNEVFENVAKGSISEDGSFELSTDDLPMEDSSSFIILFLDTTLEDEKEHIIAFYATAGDNGDNLINLPLNDIADEFDWFYFNPDGTYNELESVINFLVYVYPQINFDNNPYSDSDSQYMVTIEEGITAVDSVVAEANSLQFKVLYENNGFYVELIILIQ